VPWFDVGKSELKPMRDGTSTRAFWLPFWTYFFFMFKYLKSPENNNRFCCFDLESGWGETPLEAPDRRLHPNTGQSVDRLDKSLERSSLAIGWTRRAASSEDWTQESTPVNPGSNPI
jgi:hypothetical protein